MLKQYILQAMPYMHAIAVTAELIFVAACGGLVIAFLLLFAQKNKYLKTITNSYLFLIKGTPFLLQLYIIYYGLIQFHFIQHSWLKALFISPYICALMALIINTSAYTTTILEQMLKNIPKNEIDAAKCLGLKKKDMFVNIILPHICIKMLPAYSNELIMIMKCTAIVSTITILDVMGITQQMIALTYQTMPYLLSAAIIYLTLSMLITIPCKFIYNKYIVRFDYN